MYNRIKNILLNPKSLGEYASSKGRNIFFYFILLLLLFSLPDLIAIATTKQVGYETIAYFKQAFDQKTIPFSIENDVLIKHDDDYINEEYIIDAYQLGICFGEKSSNTKQTMVATFLNEGIALSFSSVKTMEMELIKYSEIDLEQLDFTLIGTADEEVFWKQFTVLLNQLFVSYRPVFLLIGIPSTLIALSINLLFVIVITSLIVNIMNKGLGSKFKSIFKIAIVAYTPYVLGALLSILFNLSLFTTIGSIISVIYTIVGSTNYLKQQLEAPRRDEL